MPLILALDQSTSSTKALLFDAEGRSLDRESLDHRQHYPQPGWVEHDAEEIWQNTLSVLRALLSRNSRLQSDITALSITNQRETIVVFDRASGAPLHPAMVWQCRRGSELCGAAAEAGHEPLIRERTGLKIDPYFSASKLQWLVRNRPDLRKRLESGSACIGTIDAYLIHRLTGGRVFATDTTNASRTLLFDIAKLKWDQDLCALWQVPMRALPEVRDCSATFGETTIDGLLERALPICGVMGDSQASLFAQRCFAPGSAKATFGTGTSVLLNIGEKARVSPSGVLTAVAWTLSGRPTYAFEGIIISSAATLTWLREQLGLFTDFSETEATAAALDGTDGVYLVPAFSGMGLPHWRPEARAAIVGLTGRSDRRHVIRAGLESIAYQLADALDSMRREAGVSLSTLHGDGGTTANAWLMQFTSDMTRVPLRVAAMSDCSPLGAAFAGMLGLGLVPSLDGLAALSRDDIVFEPRMPAEQALQFRSGWNSAVRQVLSPTQDAR